MKRSEESGPGNDPKKSSSTKEPNKRKHLGKAGFKHSSNKAKESQQENENRQNDIEKESSSNPESELEKVSRKGKDILELFLRNMWNNLQIAEKRTDSLETRIALKNEIEIPMMKVEFFEALEPNLQINFWKALDRSIQTEAGLAARLQAQGDINEAYYNLNKLVDNLNFIEREKEQKKLDKDSPFSPEFREKVRNEYRLRVLGLKPEPANQTDEEDSNGREEVDESTTEDSESED